jgi:hypothetical protein
MKNSLDPLSHPSEIHKEIEVVSIIIAASTATITIPIRRDAPLRCADIEELHGIAAQMESLIRVLIIAGAGNHSPAGGANGREKKTIAVW